MDGFVVRRARRGAAKISLVNLSPRKTFGLPHCGVRDELKDVKGWDCTIKAVACANTLRITTANWIRACILPLTTQLTRAGNFFNSKLGCSTQSPSIRGNDRNYLQSLVSFLAHITIPVYQKYRHLRTAAVKLAVI